jgi:heme A synthase
VPAGWALLALWTLVAFVRNKPPGDRFWNLLGVLQVILGIQAFVGAILIVSGGRPASNGPSWLHYVYGALFPVAVLVAAHRFARRQEGVSWIVFGLASVVIFGLTFRALQTGLGID